MLQKYYSRSTCSRMLALFWLFIAFRNYTWNGLKCNVLDVNSMRVWRINSIIAFQIIIIIIIKMNLYLKHSILSVPQYGVTALICFWCLFVNVHFMQSVCLSPVQYRCVVNFETRRSRICLCLWFFFLWFWLWPATV